MGYPSHAPTRNSTRKGTRNLSAAMRQIQSRTMAAARCARRAASARIPRLRTDCQRWSTSPANTASPRGVGGGYHAAVDRDQQVEARGKQFVDDALQYARVQFVWIGEQPGGLHANFIARR